MRLKVKCSVVSSTILCIATLAESGVISCRPACMRFRLIRSAVDCSRSGAFASEPSPWDLAAFHAAPCAGGLRAGHPTRLPDDLSIWVHERGRRHDVSAVSTRVNIDRDDAFTYCSQYQCPSSECKIPDQFGSSLQIDIHPSENNTEMPIMSLTLGLTIEFVSPIKENSGATRFGPLVLLWMDDPLKCRHDFVKDIIAFGSNDMLSVQREALQGLPIDDDLLSPTDHYLLIHHSDQRSHTFITRSLDADLVEDEGPLTDTIARFTEEYVHPVGPSANVPSISPSSIYSFAGSDQPSSALVNGLLTTPIETLSAVPSHINSSLREAPTGVPSIPSTPMHSLAESDQPSQESSNGRSPTPIVTRSAIPSPGHVSRSPAVLRSARPSSILPVQPSRVVSLTPMQTSTKGIFATSRPSSFNRSGLERGDSAAETSSAPERWNGLLVLVVGMLSLFATAAVVLNYTIRRRSLQGFERGRESERLSRVQEEGARRPCLESRRLDAAPLGSDEWLAGLGRDNAELLPSSPWLSGLNLGEDCESCTCDDSSGIDLESMATTTESWSVMSTPSISHCESVVSKPVECASDSSVVGFESERDCGIANRLELSKFSRGFDCDRNGAPVDQLDCSTECSEIDSAYNMTDRIEVKKLSSSRVSEVLSYPFLARAV